MHYDGIHLAREASRGRKTDKLRSFTDWLQACKQTTRGSLVRNRGVGPQAGVSHDGLGLALSLPAARRAAKSRWFARETAGVKLVTDCSALGASGRH
jgi:hypothetical protein